MSFPKKSIEKIQTWSHFLIIRGPKFFFLLSQLDHDLLSSRKIPVIPFSLSVLYLFHQTFKLFFLYLKVWEKERERENGGFLKLLTFLLLPYIVQEINTYDLCVSVMMFPFIEIMSFSQNLVFFFLFFAI